MLYKSVPLNFLSSFVYVKYPLKIETPHGAQALYYFLRNYRLLEINVVGGKDNTTLHCFESPKLVKIYQATTLYLIWR